MKTIKKCILLIAVLLLSGCPGPGDRMVERESTTAIIKNNNVCVVSPLNQNEKITAVQINSDKSSLLHKIFDDSPIYVAKGECLPLFGVTFEPGQRYTMAYNVDSGNTASHLVMSEFSITVDSSGKIKLP